MDTFYPVTVLVSKRALSPQINDGGEYSMNVRINLLSTATQLIKTILDSNSITAYDKYALFLTEAVPITNMQDGVGTKNRKPSSFHRKFHREIKGSEYPLLVQEFSQSSSTIQSNSISYTISPFSFYLTQRAFAPINIQSSFYILRKEQCKALSVNALNKRLNSINLDEEATLEKVKKKYDDLKALILERVDQL